MEDQESNESHEEADDSSNDMDKRPKNGSNCDICQKKFRSRYHLKLHLAVHSGEKNYLCGICKKAYQQKWNLITHMARVHAKEKPFQCADCNKSFGYSSHFKRHIKTHFVEKMAVPEKVKQRILNPYKCRHCDRNFDSNYRLEAHSRKHSGEKPFICDKCGIGFATKRLIANHLAKHDDKDYKCNKCGRTFTDGSGISQHLEQIQKLAECSREGGTAKKNQNYAADRDLISCEVCGKRVMRTSMRKHLNIHYRSRLYACRYCRKEFLESGQRVVHERKHTGEKPYLCDVCGKAHSQYGNLLTHRRRNHNRSEKPVIFRSVKCSTESNTTNTAVVQSDSSESRPEPNVLSEQINVVTSVSQVPLRNEGNGAGAKEKECADATLEKYLKIAGSWISKKFEESKHKKLNSCETENLRKAPENVTLRVVGSEKASMSWAGTETCDAIDDDVTGEELTSGGGRATYGRMLQAKESKACLVRQKSSPVHRTRNKINNKILEKIVEDFEICWLSRRMKETIENIKKNEERDGLKELLKLMKTFPDNKVVKIDNGKIFWVCWNCDSKFGNRHLLARHLLIHEPEDSRPYKCDHCLKTFTQSNNYKEHLMSHNDEKQFYCEKCGGGFRHKSHFNIHLKRHNEGGTAIERPKKFQCCYCERKFHTNFHKNEHMRTHTREKPHACKLCGNQFTALSTLRRHSATHAKARHQCQTCLKLFKQKSSLKRHENVIHSENAANRIFCECGKSFSQVPSLKKHKMICKSRVEPVVKPFSCAFCCKKFLTKTDVKRHEATHDKSKKFQCSLCFLKLKTGETYSRHLRRHKIGCG